MKNNYASLFIIIFSTIILTLAYGCGGDSSTGVTTKKLVSIAITPNNPITSTTLQLTATGTYSDKSTKVITSSVTWNSSNTGVATIMNSGMAISIHAGSTNITATLGSISGTTALTVTSAILSSISVTPAGSSVSVGDTKQLSASGLYSDGTTHDITTQVTWLSLKAEVATVNTSGLAKGVSAGTSSVTATYGTISGSTSITVTDSNPGISPIKLFNVGAEPWIGDIIETSSGNILVTGTQDSGTSVIVLKLDAMGNQVWNKYYSAGTDVIANHIFEVSSQEYVVTGSIYATQGALFKMHIDGSGISSSTSYYDDGLWTNSNDEVQLSDGSIVFAGGTQMKDNSTTFIPYGDALITGINSAGKQYFRHTYDFSTGNSGNSDIFYSIVATADGGFAAAGNTNEYDDGSGYGGPKKVILVKTDSMGNISWSKNFSYIADNIGNGEAIDLVQMSDESFAILVWSSSNYQLFIVITDSQGNIKKTSNVEGLIGRKFVVAADGGLLIIVRGEIVKVNSLGTKVWTYNVEYEPTAIVKSSDGKYLVAGRANMGMEGYKTFVLKIDDSGKSVW